MQITPANIVNKIANSRPIRSVVDKQISSKKFATGVAVASIVTKDALGCYYYVTQSLKNERIPEKKRKFVAALDLANGVLMVTAQILTVLVFSKLQSKMFEKLCAKYFKKPARKKIIKNLPQNLKKIISENALTKEVKNITKNVSSETKQGLGKAFNTISSIAVASIFAKRMVVPFISTPLASWVKNNILEKGHNAEATNEKQNNDKYKNLSGDSIMDVYFQNNKQMKKLYATMNSNN